MKMKRPFFSIVAPVYNAEKYIEEMVRSVFGQTFEDWELILVDDGATDCSGELCDKLAEQDGRVTVIHTPNQGGLNARYTGVAQSGGKYVIVIDADDILVKDCLTTVKGAIEDSHADMVIWGFRTFGGNEAEVRFPLSPLKIYSQKEIMYTSIMATFHSLCVRAVPASLIKDSCTCELGKLSINTDYAMLIPILGNIRNAYVIDDILYEYRIYGNSVSHSVSVQKIVDTDRVTMYAVEALSKSDVYDLTIEKAIYVSYLKMIFGQIKLLFLKDKIDSRQGDMIRSLPAFVNSRKYETREFFSLRQLVFMRCFRNSFYLPFHILKYGRKVFRSIGGWNHA